MNKTNDFNQVHNIFIKPDYGKMFTLKELKLGKDFVLKVLDLERFKVML